MWIETGPWGQLKDIMAFMLTAFVPTRLGRKDRFVKSDAGMFLGETLCCVIRMERTGNGVGSRQIWKYRDVEAYVLRWDISKCESLAVKEECHLCPC